MKQQLWNLYHKTAIWTNRKISFAKKIALIIALPLILNQADVKAQSLSGQCFDVDLVIPPALDPSIEKDPLTNDYYGGLSKEFDNVWWMNNDTSSYASVLSDTLNLRVPFGTKTLQLVPVEYDSFCDCELVSDDVLLEQDVTTYDITVTEQQVCFGNEYQSPYIMGTVINGKWYNNNNFSFPNENELNSKK